MCKNFNEIKKSKKILFFTFNFLPDQSAGSNRTKLLVEKLQEIEDNNQIIILCSFPRRYGKKFKRKNLEKEDKFYENMNIKIVRIWIPFLGQGPLKSLLSYSFYFVQAGIYSCFINPDISIVTSAKLLTAFLASISSKLNRSKLFIDIRDTFSDNYFYFYRWNKRIVLLSIIILIENFIIRSAFSINIISEGFKNAYFGWNSILKKKSIKVTYFTNGHLNNYHSKIIEYNKSKEKNKFYKLIYAGNIGEGQDLLSLVKCLASNKTILNKIIKNKIIFEIYGSGSQFAPIKKIISEENNYLLKEIIFLKGLVPKDEVKNVLIQADCLLINLANYNSLSMVIPSKIFEYVATNLPIIFSADGFTFNFISKIDGTIKFDCNDAISFYKAIVKSRKLKVNKAKREKFLNEFNSDDIYLNYAKHILGKS